ncbi:hypothetical protein BDZ94DRAFT_1134567, partial [Collybia nuda]
ILREYGYENSNSVKTPMDPGVRLSPATPEEIQSAKDFPYAAIVGKCMYLATCT